MSEELRKKLVRNIDESDWRTEEPRSPLYEGGSVGKCHWWAGAWHGRKKTWRFD